MTGGRTTARMPAEWEPHERCLMAWPVRRDLWNHHLDDARREHAATAAAIARFEPVTMVAAPGEGASAEAALPSEIEVIEMPIDDSWLRDSGPIFTLDGDRNRTGVDFAFNSWGEKFVPWDRDAEIARRLLDHFGEDRRESTMVLEGGSITVDGHGTLVTTEQCLLHPSRNPTMSRDEIEHELMRMLGVDTVIWLPWGLVEDTHTDGHVDNVCAFVRPGVVIAHACDDPTDPNHGRGCENLDVLHSAVDSLGDALEVIEIPRSAPFDIGGLPCRTSSINFYLAGREPDRGGGGVIVPTAGRDGGADADALEIIGDAFADREMVAVTSRILAYGGGGIHCITQQVPSR